MDYIPESGDIFDDERLIFVKVHPFYRCKVCGVEFYTDL